jgi:hypothetical protein
MENLNQKIEQLPTIQNHDDIEAARSALASARGRLHELEDRKAELKAQIPQLRDRVDDLRVQVATGDATEGELQEARQAVTDAEDELKRLETRQIPSQQQAVERLDDRTDEVLDRLGNQFAGAYQEMATQLLDRKAEALRAVARVLDAVDSFDSKRGENRISNAYGPSVPSVPTLSETVRHRGDELDAEALRTVADELEEQAEKTRKRERERQQEHEEDEA